MAVVPGVATVAMPNRQSSTAAASQATTETALEKHYRLDNSTRAVASHWDGRMVNFIRFSQPTGAPDVCPVKEVL